MHRRKVIATGESANDQQLVLPHTAHVQLIVSAHSFGGGRGIRHARVKASVTQGIKRKVVADYYAHTSLHTGMHVDASKGVHPRSKRLRLDYHESSAAADHRCIRRAVAEKRHHVVCEKSTRGTVPWES